MNNQFKVGARFGLAAALVLLAAALTAQWR